MLSDLAGFVLATVFGAWLLGLVVSGLRTGRIHHTNSTATYSFRMQPIRFILVAAFFTALSAMLFYFAFTRAFAVWHVFVA
ncbi:MAG: hypothetical protein KDE65_00350 [Burkholderiaceae bacterium]|jgi:hypothetical protein|nr:hypothetical protein [Burkholderiaceae bacterium]